MRNSRDPNLRDHLIEPEARHRLLVLTGASGSGKTAIVQYIRAHALGEAELLHFDDAGIPSLDKMCRLDGTTATSQRRAMHDWIRHVASTHLTLRPVLLEGSVRLSFIREACVENGIDDAHIVLIDCDEKTRAHRLTTLRGQPELVNDDLRNWAAYLREEAKAQHVPVVDTSHLSLADAAHQVLMLARTAPLA